ncbi:MAG: mechanosensitive ion channel family protein [Candidatus Saccharibacteria bacterium]
MESSQNLHAFLQNRLVQVLLTLIVAVVVQLLARKPIDRIVRRAIRGHRYTSKEEERKREDTLINVFHTALMVIIWIITLVVILFELKINVAGLLTGAGVVGVVVSLGAQSTIRDFLAGIFIIMENQYRVGDVVNLSAGVPGGVSGVVEDITVRITRLRDMDGNIHIVSNGLAGVVTNMTFQFANVNVDIPISYSSDIDKVKDIINEVGIELAGDKERGPDVVEAVQFLRLDQFGDSVIIVKALGKVKAGAQWDVAGEFRRRLKAAFDKKGIDLPYPQVVVHQTHAVAHHRAARK